ncbi:MDR family MFS transporter [Actinomadura rupiterrae]|uniref:MDR family MFS transporter n=1 Tax=Actinomadura rupiterrae TaxID=559627 RepID=UPI0020A3DF81|nr:MDR family MFS transporter [Actinomadura rupiterrae]MCP2340728.1 EmrB/QacA subfamily drug resistance transporter [Actinomadura rupiterrae]
MAATLTAADTAAPARTLKPMTIALILVLGGIMVSLDTTVVNVAINRLSETFDASLATIQWIATGYSLALGAMVPTAAWAVGRFGAKRLYLTAVAAFALGSVLAGLAWDVPSMIAFRVLQGLAGGLVMPAGMTILIRAAKPEELGKLMGTNGLAILVGPLAGPALGGWLIDQVSWRWMFFINLPVGLAILLLAGRLFPADAPAARRALDVPGLLLLSPGLAALIYGVTRFGDGADGAAPLLWIAAGLALATAFAVRARFAAHPLIDLGLFRTRTFSAASATLTVFSAGYFGTMILAPLYFQVVRGESATVAGLLAMPGAFASGIAMQVAGRLVDRIGAGRIVPVSVAAAATGFVLLAVQLTADGSYWGIAGATALIGGGGGATIMPALTAATKGVSHEQAPAASTTVNLITTTMSAVGIASASALLSARLPDGGIQAVHRLTGPAREAAAPTLAHAFQLTYLLPLSLVVAALVPALLIRSRRTP